MAGSYIQYGCGFCAPDGWVNFDASPTLLFERIPLLGKLFTKNMARFPANVRYGDIVKGLPIREGTVDGVYASHVLEHLPLADCQTALVNTWRLLKPGGIFRLIVPDLRWRASEYVDAAAAGDPNAGADFIRSTDMGTETRARGPVGLASAIWGHSRHLWMWDEASMRSALQRAGFREIRRFAMGDAEDQMFARVEEFGRLMQDDHPELAMEARK